MSTRWSFFERKKKVKPKGFTNGSGYISLYILTIGVYYNWPKFKYQLWSDAGWFSYKIWTKNSKTPIVNLLKKPKPFRNYTVKIQWEIHFFDLLTFWLFKILAKTLWKKILELKYGHSHFKSAFGINFGLWEAVKLKIHVYAYTCIFSLTTSRSPKLILKADLKWECP